MSYFTRAVNRINNIDVEQYFDLSHKRYDEVRSKGEYSADATLIAEYYRRVGVLLQSLNKDSASIYSLMSKIIDTDTNNLDYDTFLSICPIPQKINFLTIKIICFGYLEWCSLLDIGHSIALKYSDIYEPIIKLFERGGGQISIHHHELVGGFGAFPRYISADRGNMKEFDIIDSALDQIVKEVNGEY
ncbi:MAG: hypothetical protein LBJ04_08310 [Sphingobacterium sp.]|jgi:hypothetical protein|nr:hypothetical protein [Sphingobacterium sp.]